MLLPVLTVAAILIGGFLFTASIKSRHDANSVTRSSSFSDKKVSL